MPLRLFVRRAEQALVQLGWQVDVEETRNGPHATDLAQQAATAGFDAVFAAGGDGTIGQAAAGLAGSQTILGVLPAGTTNVLAADLGLQSFDWNRWWALEENVRRLVSSQIVSSDVGVCNDRPFLLWAGIGLDAMTIQRQEPRPRFEKFISVPVYAAQTIWNASIWNGQNMNFEIDGNRLDGHFQLAVINNIRTYLGGMAVLSPDAQLDDGIMDLWLFKGSNLGDAFRHAFGMMSGRHLTSPDAMRIPFKHLVVESDTPLVLQTDGDPAGIATRAHFSVLPGALRLFAPQQSLRLFKHAASSKGKAAVLPLFSQL